MLKNFNFVESTKYLLIFIAIIIIFLLNIFLLRVVKRTNIFLQKFLSFFYFKKKKMFH